MTDTVLVTGFEPFGGETVNPAWETVRLLPDRIAGCAVVKKQLPTVFGAGAAAMLAAASACDPRLILMLGQAGGRDAVTPEQVAVNLRRARIPDNAGARPLNGPVVPGGPDALFPSVPVLEVTARMAEEGCPVKLSYTAGTFVCNDVFYTAVYTFRGTGVKTAFVHVPYLPDQAPAGVPAMSQGTILRTVARFLALAL